jgi:hypothetical protein
LTVTLALSATASARTITVDTLDGGAAADSDCSLFEAITAANDDAPEDGCRRGDGADEIVFEIASALIEPTAALPPITERVVLDGSDPTPSTERVVLDGDSAGGANGFTVETGRTTIRSFVVQEFAFDGINIAGNRNKVTNCRVGTAALLSSEGNGNQGIDVVGSENRIGGGTTATGNLVSGNTQEGVVVDGTGNVVRNNLVGTIFNGGSGLGNGLDGIEVDGTANVVGPGNVVSDNGTDGIDIDGSRHVVRGNIVGLSGDGEVQIGNSFNGVLVNARRSVLGGKAPGDRNVISGNVGEGIELDAGADRNRILGNFIGVDADGNEAQGNAGSGIDVEDSSANTIGGDEQAERNVISGNGGVGIVLSNELEPIERNRIIGNRIGTDPAGTVSAGFGNGEDGIETSGEVIDNTIGGTTKGTGNLIAGNAEDGIQIRSDSQRNSILRNSIHTNTGLGIELGTDGVTANDFGMMGPHDIDLGGNGLQNYPVITEVGPAAGRIEFDFSSTANRRFRIEAFVSDNEDSSDHGEGQRFVGARVVRTNAAGNVVGGVLQMKNPQTGFVSLTATRLGPDDDPLDTSEFSETDVSQ